MENYNNFYSNTSKFVDNLNLNLIGDKDYKNQTEYSVPLNINLNSNQINSSHDKSPLSPFNNSETGKILLLTILNTNSQKPPKTIRIGECGMIEGSLRREKDRITYFGNVSDFEEDQDDPEKAVDYIISQKVKKIVEEQNINSFSMNNNIDNYIDKNMIETAKDSKGNISDNNSNNIYNNNNNNNNNIERKDLILSVDETKEVFTPSIKTDENKLIGHVMNKNTCSNKEDASKSNNQNYNDQVSNNESQREEYHCGRFFQISFNQMLNEFLIKDLGNGMGTFVKINGRIDLPSNSLFCIGNTFVIAHYEEEDHDNLSLKIYNENISEDIKEYIFTPSENPLIKIGRLPKGNNVTVNDYLISKTHCMLVYNEFGGWGLIDGYEETVEISGELQKEIIPSTNGTWLLALEEQKITEGLTFKSGFHLFTCKIISTSEL